MICTECGRTNSDADKFCEQCGAPMNVAQSGNGANTAAPSALVLLGSDVDTSYRLGARAVIGRVDNCDVTIHDQSVSTEHARLTRLRNGYVVEDLGSSNGTFVNGKRIDEAVPLDSKDVLTVGTVDLRFDGPSDETEQNGTSDLTMVGATVGTVNSPEAADTEDKSNDEAHAAHLLTELAVVESLNEEEPSPRFAELSDHVHPNGDSGDTGVNLVTADNEPDPQSEEEPLSSVPYSTPESTMAPVTSGASTDSEVGDLAVKAVKDLVAQSNEVRAKLEQAEAARNQLQQDLSQAENVSRKHETVKQLLRATPQTSVQQEELESTRGAVDALVSNPKDVEVLMRLGQQSGTLANLVAEYGQLREVVERLKQENLDN